MGVKAKNSSTRGEEERMGMKPNGAIAPLNEQNLKEQIIFTMRFSAPRFYLSAFLNAMKIVAM
jgi:hypothetical protein